MKKKSLFTFCMMALLLASCNLPSSATPVVPTESPVVIPTNTISTGGVVSLNNVSFTIPLGVAGDVLSEMVSAVTDTNNSPLWEIAPDHLHFTLTGYQLQGKFLEPQIWVYPADEYAKLNTFAAGEIQKLKAIVTGAPLTTDAMPSWVTNAGQLMIAKMQVIDFNSGRGVRYLTQYAQYPAIINNREMFYLFHGLTSDGRYYIVATLPVTSSILPEDEKPESPLPQGGVPYSTETGPNDAYYDAVAQALNGMYEDSFNPSLFQLDALIQSITVTP